MGLLAPCGSIFLSFSEAPLPQLTPPLLPRPPNTVRAVQTQLHRHGWFTLQTLASAPSHLPPSPSLPLLIFFFHTIFAWQDPNLLTDLLEGVSYENTWQTQYLKKKKKTKLKKKNKTKPERGGEGGKEIESQQGRSLSKVRSQMCGNWFSSTTWGPRLRLR